MRTESIVCDWCRTSDEMVDDDPIEMGWLAVEVYDTIAEEVKQLDFCSRECLVSNFG